MKKIIIAVVLIALFFVVVSPLPVWANWAFCCKHTMHNSTYAVICLSYTQMELWNQLDWGDGDVGQE